jgi:hypothetical protein
VAYNRLTLRIPPGCPHCGTEDRIQPEQSITGVIVLLSWRCQKCLQQWPVTADEQLPERRNGQPDMRLEPRDERRRAAHER